GGARIDIGAYVGGRYAVVFLTPRGYHHVHMPADGVLRQVSFVPGRFFPQNESALEHISGVYERHERAVLRFRFHAGGWFVLVLVGASLVGGIHLEALPRAEWVKERPVDAARRYEKGEKIGHFAFGSTVVLLLPPGTPEERVTGGEIRMGQTLFAS